MTKRNRQVAKVATPDTEATEVVATEVVATEVVATEVVATEAVAPEAVAPEAPATPEADPVAPEAPATPEAPANVPLAVVAPDPVAFGGLAFAVLTKSQQAMARAKNPPSMGMLGSVVYTDVGAKAYNVRSGPNVAWWHGGVPTGSPAGTLPVVGIKATLQANGGKASGNDLASNSEAAFAKYCIARGWLVPAKV